MFGLTISRIGSRRHRSKGCSRPRVPKVRHHPPKQLTEDEIERLVLEAIPPPPPVVSSLRKRSPVPLGISAGVAAFRGVVLGGTEVSRSILTSESRVMVSGQDAQKRRAWEVRFGRFRASGLTVARFCEQERVSTHTFYYWAKRVGSASVKLSTVYVRQRVAAGSPVREAHAHGRPGFRTLPWSIFIAVRRGRCVGAGRLPGCDSLSRRVPPAREGGTFRRLSGSRREFVTGKAERCCPRRFCPRWGRRRSTFTPSQPT